ncbi:MAG: IS5 family transposase [Pseudomonadales bacterium]
MRGQEDQQPALFSYISLEDRVPVNHPIRTIRKIVDSAIEQLDDPFEAMYSAHGRPSIAPERLIRALLLQILYSIRSERQLVERLNYDLLFRWFVGLNIDDAVWHATTFTKNRDRLLACDIAEGFFAAVSKQASAKKLLSKDHFTVDGTLIEACASMKSYRPKADEDDPGSGVGRNPDSDFHGTTRQNDTHESKTDPDCRLAKKGPGKEAKLSYMGHLLTENRHGLIVDARVTPATGTAEREAAFDMIAVTASTPNRTLGGDKNYDTKAFIEDLRAIGVTPHLAPKLTSVLDGRTFRHAGYAISQRKRKRIEECFGWMKTVGLLRKLRHRGQAKVDWNFRLTAAVYNIVRLKNIELASAK